MIVAIHFFHLFRLFSASRLFLYFLFFPLPRFVSSYSLCFLRATSSLSLVLHDFLGFIFPLSRFPLLPFYRPFLRFPYHISWFSFFFSCLLLVFPFFFLVSTCFTFSQWSCSVFFISHFHLNISCFTSFFIFSFFLDLPCSTFFSICCDSLLSPLPVLVRVSVSRVFLLINPLIPCPFPDDPSPTYLPRGISFTIT